MSNQDTYMKILTAAKEAFSEYGFSGVTTKELAKKAGVNEVTLFRHFKNKYNLFSKVFEHFLYLPNFEFSNEYMNQEPQVFMIDIGLRLYSVFLENKSMLLIEMKNNDLSLRKKISKFPMALKKKISNFAQTKMGMDEISADIMSTNYISFISGLFMNTEIFKNFTMEIDYKKCIEQYIGMIL